MIDYQKSKIYTVRCFSDQSLIYVGSTTQTLSKRWGDHKDQWKSGNHLPFHKLITDIKDWYIQLEEEFPCDNKEQLIKKEFELMRKISTLNRNQGHNYASFDNPTKLPPKETKNYKNWRLQK